MTPEQQARLSIDALHGKRAGMIAIKRIIACFSVTELRQKSMSTSSARRRCGSQLCQKPLIPTISLKWMP